MSVSLVILGQPSSKSNRSQIINLGGHSSLVKSKEALAYERSALLQIPSAARQRLEGPVKVTMTIFYANERSDLDESLILDCLQDQSSRTKKDKAGNVIRAAVLLQAGVYRNDRQVRWKDIRHAIDEKNPRAVVLVEALEAQQQSFELTPVALERPARFVDRSFRRDVQADPFEGL